MKGLIVRTLAAACVAGSIAAIGCQSTGERDGAIYDRCWPQRYSHSARQAVVDGFAPQVQNGHVLDQTIWNYHFDAGTDKLSPSGLAKIESLVRRRPNADASVFIATAHDVTYDPADPEKYAETRRDLDVRRVAAIQKYLQVQMAGRSMSFDVQIHDPYPVGQSGVVAAINARNYQSGGSLLGGGGGGSSGSVGASGGSGSSGNGSSATGSSGQGGSSNGGGSATAPRQ